MNFSLHSLQILHPRSLKHLSNHLQVLVQTRLWMKILLALLLGILVGILLGPTVDLISRETAHTLGEWLAMPGQLFLVLIQMVVIPLVFASIIRGIAGTEDLEQLKLLGSRSLLYFILTTVVAIVIGIGLAFLIEPGHQSSLKEIVSTITTTEARFQADATMQKAESVKLITVAQLPEEMLKVLPQNPFNAMSEGQMLQLVVFAMIIGMALLAMPANDAKPLLEMLGSIQKVSMVIVRWAMMLAPYAVFGLMARIMSKVGLEAVFGLGIYMGTVLLGLLLVMIMNLVIITLVAGKNPFGFLQTIKNLLLLAFSTSSSATVMPLSIKTAEDGLGVRPSIAQFVVPLGATINMNGSALYFGVATVFLAQLFQVDLSLGALILLILTAVGASIGSPGTPGVGISILILILKAVGIPPTGAVLVLGVDRVLDMSRTMVNVTGDLAACLVLDRWVGGKYSAHQEHIHQQYREARRVKTGEDVITGTLSE